MGAKDNLRDTVHEKGNQLSEEQLIELSSILRQLESQFKSKEVTLSLAGKWDDLTDDFFTRLTTDLHKNRMADRQISAL